MESNIGAPIAPEGHARPRRRGRAVHREDALSTLRHYARGYVAGAFAEWSSEIVAIEMEALALSLLGLLQVPPLAAAELLDQARIETRCAVPRGTTRHDVRALAAQRIIILVRARLARLDAVAEATSAPPMPSDRRTTRAA